MGNKRSSLAPSEWGKVFYKLIYVVVYSLILIGEVVRQTIAKAVKTIGYIVFFIVKIVVYILTSAVKISIPILSRFLALFYDISLKILQSFKSAMLYILEIPAHILQIITKVVPSVLSIPRGIGRRMPRLRIPHLQSVKWFLFGAIFTTLFVFLPFILITWLGQLPNPQSLSYMKFPATTKFFDRDGKLLYELYAEIDRQPIPLAEIPQHVIDATLAIEDQEFYHHLGFSPRGIVRAMRETFLKQNIQGGSTITQQLIKNTLLTPAPTIRRKIKELILAFWAERIYSKEQILEMYLNNVPYGGTAWGIKAASQKYFQKSVSELTVAEGALLAGLPAAPTTYSPLGARPELARQRQRLVLARMRELGYITVEEERGAKTTELEFNSAPHNIKAPHFVMYTKQQLEKLYGPRLVEQGGLQIKTTLDLELQNRIQEIVQEELTKIAHLNVGNAAVLITQPETGEILAMVGSRDYYDTENDGNVNITTTLQQPGSSIKVVTYSAALQNGFTAATIINDSPVSFPQPNRPPYSPVNYDSRFHGSVPLRWALANSYNVPAVKVLNRIGVKTMIEQGRLMGINTWEDENRFGLALTLGGGEVTMIDMAEVYGTLANLGKRVDTSPVLEVVDFQGEALEEFIKPEVVDALPAEVAFILTDILADNVARTPAFGADSQLATGDKYVAAKTGTSNNKRDNWTIGYTKDFVVVVWVGNNDNSPMHPILTSGITGATPIWRRVMDFLLKDREVLPPPVPAGLVKMPCYGRQEYFTAETVPKNGCPRWSLVTPTPTGAQQ